MFLYVLCVCRCLGYVARAHYYYYFYHYPLLGYIAHDFIDGREGTSGDETAVSFVRLKGNELPTAMLTFFPLSTIHIYPCKRSVSQSTFFHLLLLVLPFRQPRSSQKGDWREHWPLNFASRRRLCFFFFTFFLGALTEQFWASFTRWFDRSFVQSIGTAAAGAAAAVLMKVSFYLLLSSAGGSILLLELQNVAESF